MVKDYTAILIIAKQEQITDVEGGYLLVFQTKKEPDNPTFHLLLKKLNEAGVIFLPFSDGQMFWFFTNEHNEKSFVEAFKWFIIYE